jgi:hypothetical protein
LFDCSIGQSHRPSKEIDDDDDHDDEKEEDEHDDEVDALPPREFMGGHATRRDDAKNPGADRAKLRVG